MQDFSLGCRASPLSGFPALASPTSLHGGPSSCLPPVKPFSDRPSHVGPSVPLTHDARHDSVELPRSECGHTFPTRHAFSMYAVHAHAAPSRVANALHGTRTQHWTRSRQRCYFSIVKFLDVPDDTVKAIRRQELQDRATRE